MIIYSSVLVFVGCWWDGCGGVWFVEIWRRIFGILSDDTNVREKGNEVVRWVCLREIGYDEWLIG